MFHGWLVYTVVCTKYRSNNYSNYDAMYLYSGNNWQKHEIQRQIQTQSYRFEIHTKKRNMHNIPAVNRRSNHTFTSQCKVTSHHRNFASYASKLAIIVLEGRAHAPCKYTQWLTVMCCGLYLHALTYCNLLCFVFTRTALLLFVVVCIYTHWFTVICCGLYLHTLSHCNLLWFVFTRTASL